MDKCDVSSSPTYFWALRGLLGRVGNPPGQSVHPRVFPEWGAMGGKQVSSHIKQDPGPIIRRISFHLLIL